MQTFAVDVRRRYSLVGNVPELPKIACLALPGVGSHDSMAVHWCLEVLVYGPQNMQDMQK